MELLQENSLDSYLKQTKNVLFFLLQNGKTGEQNRSYLGRFVPLGGRRRWGKDTRGLM
jgi:hypothetical protein